MFGNTLVDFQPHLVTFFPKFENSKVKETALVDREINRN